VLGSQGGPEARAGVRSRVRQSGRARIKGWRTVREEGYAVREGQKPGLEYRVVLGSQGGPEARAGVRSRVRQSGRARIPGLEYSKGGGLGSQGGPEARAGVRSRVRQSGRARIQGWSTVREEG
jgi:hypothetical protein